MANPNSETLLMIFIGITAVAVLLQAGVLLGIYLTVRKAVATAKDEADAYRSKVTPIIESGSQLINTANELVASTKTLLDNIQPHLESAVSELSSMAGDIHSQANQLQAAVDEVAQKARYQVNRVDGMATSALDALNRFGRFLNQAVNLPIRQVNGVVAAAKAVVDALRTPGAPRPPRRASTPTPVGEDKDLFV